MKGRQRMKWMIKKAAICIASLSLILASPAASFAAAPYLELIRTASNGQTAVQVSVKGLADDTAAVQFDLKPSIEPTLGADFGTDGWSGWDAALAGHYRHVTDSALNYTFYVTGNGLPIQNGTLKICEMVFPGTAVTFPKTGELKYVGADFSKEETVAQAEIKVSDGSGGDSGGSSGGGSGSGGGGGRDSNSSSSSKTDDSKGNANGKTPESGGNGTQTPAFGDVQEHWAYASIEYCAQKGLMNGVGDGAFQPEGTVTRAMLVQTLYNLQSRLNHTEAAGAGGAFSDVDSAEWYAKAVNWAAGNGIVSGVGEGLFQPNAPVTREQMAVMFINYGTYANLSLTQDREALVYTDASEISGWAADAIASAGKAGILSGQPDGSFAPQAQATRAQLAVVLQNYTGAAKLSF